MSKQPETDEPVMEEDVEKPDSDRRPLLQDDNYDDDDAPPNLWGRTFAIGVFNLIGSFVVTGVALGHSVWMALGFVVGLCLVFDFVAPWMWFCFYTGKRQKRKEWRKTLSRVVLIGCFWGSVTGLVAGYFARDLYFAEHKTSYDVVDSNQPATSFPNFGKANKFTGSVQPVVSGRAIGYGFFPVCVAPIVDESTTKDVSFFAVGHGPCCTQQIPVCPDWSTTIKLGGIVLERTEFYPSLSSAIDDAKTRYGLRPNAQAVFVVYGDANQILSNLRFRALVISLVGGSIGLLLQLRKAVWGDY